MNEIAKLIEEHFAAMNARLDGFAREIKAIRDNQVSRQDLNTMLDNVQTTKTATNRMMAEFHLLANAMNRLDPTYTPLPEPNPEPQKGSLGETFGSRNKKATP